MGYSPTHKGFKCLDPSSGRVYVSLDVIFDESVFPFQSLHENAGRCLSAEIDLLPQSLLNLNTFGNGVAQSTGHVTNLPNDTNNSVEETSVFQENTTSDMDVSPLETNTESDGDLPVRNLPASASGSEAKLQLSAPTVGPNTRFGASPSEHDTYVTEPTLHPTTPPATLPGGHVCRRPSIFRDQRWGGGCRIYLDSRDTLIFCGAWIING